MDDMMPGPQAVTVNRETWYEIWPEAKQLMLDHGREVGQTDPRMPLIPASQQIIKLEQAGGLLIVSARQALSGSLVGYSIWYIMPSLETDGLWMAQMAPWYVKPEWRDRGVAARLWKESIKILRGREIKLLHVHWPAHGAGQSLEKFFTKQGAIVIGTEAAIWLEG